MTKKIATLLTLAWLLPVFAVAQQGKSSLDGIITLKGSGDPIENVTVTIIELNRTVRTGTDGRYCFNELPQGRYNVSVQLEGVTNMVRTVEVTGGKNPVDFQLEISGINEQVTVTASGSLESLNSSYQSVSTVGAVQLASQNSLSVGEALRNEPGVANRSFGPGTGRPVVRGFDGDRVLVLVDGLRPGGIASQSGDEVEPVDLLSLERVEIVRGPATLLYGSNAIGGVVNGISTNDLYQNGLSGYATGFGSSNGLHGGISGGFKYGYKSLMFFGAASDQRSSNYRTPLGQVRNSFVSLGSFSGGTGWFPRKGWLSFDYSYDRRGHGIPVEPDEVDLESLKERRSSYRFRGGFREVAGPIEGGDFAVGYNDYQAREFEFETDEGITELDSLATNQNLNYRANFNQRRRGLWSGTIGISGFTRDYESVGAEAPEPRTKQNSLASYALERIDFEHIGFQLGGRIEQNGYNPVGDFRSRNFVGFSGGAGVRVPLWKGGSFVANYQHSFRAPALEELYNNGPHPGIQVFDIGNQNLTAEQGDGVDLSVRHTSDRTRFDASFYYYNLQNFVYTRFTGETDEHSGLPVIRYDQANSRFYGAEANVQTKLVGGLWFEGQLDLVQAELTDLNKSLPRIPPLRGTVGVDWRYKALSFRPEFIMVDRQDRVFDNESPTAGYGVVNFDATYTLFTKGAAHIITFSGYNLADKLYFNHL